MKKQRFDSIPLPSMVVDAITTVRREQCVIHSVKFDENGKRNKEKNDSPELTSENHAFYLGKLIPMSFADRARSVMGWGNVKQRLYNPEFIRGALDYLLNNVKKGEKARVVVCRCLSELMNGHADVKDALTIEDQIAIIKKIAKKEFNAGEEKLEVNDLEQIPHHKEFFEKLRASVDPGTGQMDVENAFAEDPDEIVINELSTLHIARRLFAAATSDEGLAEDLERTRPARIKGDDENESAKYYSLAEIAIRLSDMLNGCFIQGGSERQAIYNGIIIDLIKGEDGKYKNIEELKPLFRILKGRRFETLFLNNDKNYYHYKKIQTLARLRALIFAALGFALGAGIFEGGREYGNYQQKKRREQVDKILKTSLKDHQFYLDGPFMPIDKKFNVDRFHGIEDSVMDNIKDRYHLDDEICDELKPFLQKFLLDHRDKLQSMYQYHKDRTDMADLFVMKNMLYFKERGIDLERPYQHLYEYIPMMKALFDSEDDIPGSDSEYDYQGPGGGMDPRIRAEHIGAFKGGEYFGEEFEFYLIRRFGSSEPRLVARDKFKEGAGSGRRIFSSSKAREGARAFFKAMKRFDTLSLYDFHYDLLKMQSHDISAKEEAPKCAVKKIKDDEYVRQMYKPKSYKDYFGKFEYEVIRVPTYDKDTDGTIKCMYAKAPGDKFFTRERMMEVVKYYCKAKGRYCL